MTVSVDIWLRGQDFARTEQIAGVAREPRVWTDDDVRAVLHGMLLAMHRLKHPDEIDRPVVLRGISWIVNPFEDGGVVIAIEITMGAAIPITGRASTPKESDRAKEASAKGSPARAPSPKEGLSRLPASGVTRGEARARAHLGAPAGTVAGRHRRVPAQPGDHRDKTDRVQP